MIDLWWSYRNSVSNMIQLSQQLANMTAGQIATLGRGRQAAGAVVAEKENAERTWKDMAKMVTGDEIMEYGGDKMWQHVAAWNLQLQNLMSTFSHSCVNQLTQLTQHLWAQKAGRTKRSWTSRPKSIASSECLGFNLWRWFAEADHLG